MQIAVLYFLAKATWGIRSTGSVSKWVSGRKVDLRNCTFIFDRTVVFDAQLAANSFVLLDNNGCEYDISSKLASHSQTQEFVKSNGSASYVCNSTLSGFLIHSSRSIRRCPKKPRTAVVDLYYLVDSSQARTHTCKHAHDNPLIKQ